MNIEIKIDEFEGPLDLLLHLIKEAKMSIFDFSVEEIVFGVITRMIWKKQYKIKI